MVSIDSIDERATIDGQQLAYDIVLAALSPTASERIQSVRDVVSNGAKIADGAAIDAAHGLRWLGGVEQERR